MLIDDLDIIIRDEDLNFIGWNVAPAELTCRVDWLDVSGWTLTVPTFTTDEFLDRRVSIDAINLDRRGAGIVIRDRTSTSSIPVFSGLPFLTSGGLKQATKRYVAEQDGIEVDLFSVSGVADLGILDERVVDIYATEDQVLTGVASTVVHQLLDSNLGAGAAGQQRDEPRVNLGADPVVGENISVGYSPGESLLEVVRKACVLGGITVDAYQFSDHIQIIIREPADLSDNIVFSSELGTLSSWSLSDEPGITKVWGVRPSGPFGREVSLSGTTTSLASRLIERTAVISGNIEIGFATSQEFQQRKGYPTLKADAIVSGLRFGVDFRVGDLVAVDIPDLQTGESTRRTERITGVELKLTPDGAETSIEIGGPEPYGTDAMLRALRDQAREIQALKLQG